MKKLKFDNLKCCKDNFCKSLNEVNFFLNRICRLKKGKAIYDLGKEWGKDNNKR